MTYVVIFKKTIVQNEDSENGCFFTALFHGCGSIQKYSVNRINDFMDIFNFGVEENVFGIHFILPFQDTSKGKGIGLRSGNLGRYKLGSKKRMKFYKFEMKNNIPYRLISIDEYEIGEFNFNIASFYYEPSEGSRRSKNYLSLVASLAVTCRNRYEYVLIEFDDAIQGCSFVNGKPSCSK